MHVNACDKSHAFLEGYTKYGGIYGAVQRYFSNGFLPVYLPFWGCHGKENSFILGRVNMQGAIIDTTCTISFGNQKQTIDMGNVILCLNLFVMEQAAAGFLN